MVNPKPVTLTLGKGPVAWWRDGEYCGAIDSALGQLAESGPTRILCDDGYARSVKGISDVDANIYSVAPVVFIRNDGWTLGVHAGNQKDAYKLWGKEWVAFIEGGKFGNWPRPMSEYKR